MNTDHSTQSATCTPHHFAHLQHPLIQYPNSPSIVNCRDTLHNASYLLDLLDHLEINAEAERGGLSEEAAMSFSTVIKVLKDTLRYVSNTLEDLDKKNTQDRLDERLKYSPLLRAMPKPEQMNKDSIYNTMADCLGISRSELDEVITTAERWEETTDSPGKED